MTTREKILNQIKQAALAVDSKAEVILFGSRARGDMHAESDWDILVLTNQVKPSVAYKAGFYSKLYQIELQNNIVIGTLIRNRTEWNGLQKTFLYKEIEAQGQRI